MPMSVSAPDQPVGYVAGRWVRATQTAQNADYTPGVWEAPRAFVTLRRTLPRGVVPDTTVTPSGVAGVVHDSRLFLLDADGVLVDETGATTVALAVGRWRVSVDSPHLSWPSYEVEVTEEHTQTTPLWLPAATPVPSGPTVVQVVTEESRLAAEAAASSSGASAAAAAADAATATAARTAAAASQAAAKSSETAAATSAQQALSAATAAPQITNIVSDGNFASGVGAWGTNGVISAANGVLKFTADNPSDSTWRVVPNILGHTYYLAATVKSSSSKVELSYAARQGQVYHSGSGLAERLSVTYVEAYGTSGSIRVMDQRSTGWTPIEITNVVMIDLTAAFGAGHEPTRLEMDRIIAAGWPSGWVPGTVALSWMLSVRALTPPWTDRGERFASKLRLGGQDVSVAVAGDSTGNDANEWVALWAQRIAAAYPALRVEYLAWNYANAAYNATHVYQEGSGSGGTLRVYNASVAGSRLDTHAALRAGMFPVPLDLLIINSGHNYGTATPAAYWDALDTFIAQYRTVDPAAGVVVTAQNPEVAPSTGVATHLARNTSLREYAARRGYGYLPVGEEFAARIAAGAADLIMADGLHPTTAGSAVWADVVTTHFETV